jgi:hypothetical protein
MATSSYMNGRKKYGRPQAMLWAENPGSLQGGAYIPDGYEVGYDDASITNLDLLNQFIILSDDNRSEINFAPIRIEQRRRMINGRMRSFHVADKLSITVSWDMLPSRYFAIKPKFGVTGNPLATIDHDDDEETAGISVGTSGSPNSPDYRYTTDGGAGGVELLSWYDNHPGPFWVYLAYDKYSNFTDGSAENSKYGRLAQYNEIVEMYIADFSYSVVKRGSSNHDFWNISVTLEEV